MAKEFTIGSLVENTLQNGINLCRFLESDPEKAIKQIKETVYGCNDEYLRVLVRTLNFYLKTHPLIFLDLKSQLLKEEPSLLLTLMEAGLNAP